MQLQVSKYSAQLTKCDKNQDVVCAHGTVHTEHYAKSLVVNNTISLTAFCHVSLVLILFPWVILSELAYVCIFLLSTVFGN